MADFLQQRVLSGRGCSTSYHRTFVTRPTVRPNVPQLPCESHSQEQLFLSRGQAHSDRQGTEAQRACKPWKLQRLISARSAASASGADGLPQRDEQAFGAGAFQEDLQPAQKLQHEQEQQRSWYSWFTDSLKVSKQPEVPWGFSKVVQVMVLWVLAYILIGQVAVPLVLSSLGIDRMELTMRGHAVLHLCLDITQMITTLFILWFCLRDFKPRTLGLFPVKWKGLWPLWVLLIAAICFPAVDWLSTQSQNWFPLEDNTWATHLENSLTLGDWITNVAYFTVVSVCAPIWEEAIFRGFLLVSLTKYVGNAAAVLGSSVLFALCHFRVQTFLPLVVLGMVFATVFLRTRNLVPPVILHSLWNLYVLLTLLTRSI